MDDSVRQKQTEGKILRPIWFWDFFATNALHRNIGREQMQAVSARRVGWAGFHGRSRSHVRPFSVGPANE